MAAQRIRWRTALETARSKAVGSQAPHPLEHSFLPLLAWIGERLKERLIAVRAATSSGAQQHRCILKPASTHASLGSTGGPHSTAGSGRPQQSLVWGDKIRGEHSARATYHASYTVMLSRSRHTRPPSGSNGYWMVERCGSARLRCCPNGVEGTAPDEAPHGGRRLCVKMAGTWRTAWLHSSVRAASPCAPTPTRASTRTEASITGMDEIA